LVEFLAYSLPDQFFTFAGSVFIFCNLEVHNLRCF
jgi:hypothetical protein